MLYNFSRTVISILLKGLFCLRIHGTENIPSPPYIIVSNHSSFLDPPLVGVACSRHQVHFMAKKELFDTFFLGAWVRKIGCISVRREGSSTHSFKEAIKRIEEGKVVGIFPEGTRSLNGNLQEAKRGAGFLIARAKVPFLPVYVKGSNTAAPKTGGIKFRSSIDIFIGKPVAVPGYENLVEKRNYVGIGKMVMENIRDLERQS